MSHGGISHLLDEVPYKNLQPLKSQLIAHFGRGKYYRFYREESYLSPEDQNYIRRTFHQYNIPGEPAFDSYSEEYNGRKVIFSPLFMSFYH